MNKLTQAQLELLQFQYKVDIEPVSKLIQKLFSDYSIDTYTAEQSLYFQDLMKYLECIKDMYRPHLFPAKNETNTQ